MMAIEVLESRGQQKQGADFCGAVAKAFAASDNATVKSVAAKFAGVVRRLTLVGNKIELSGNYLDGQPVKSDDYRNKVLLVMFWATWCGPCLAELPDVKAEYQLYHAKGFDVLGVSLDTEAAELAGSQGASHSLAHHLQRRSPACQVRYSPGRLLRRDGHSRPIPGGQDGKVVSTEVREKLHEELEKLLGPPGK